MAAQVRFIIKVLPPLVDASRSPLTSTASAVFASAQVVRNAITLQRMTGKSPIYEIAPFQRELIAEAIAQRLREIQT